MTHMSSVALFWRLNESRYNMVGTKCTVCSSLFFPPKLLCPKCRRKGAVHPYKFSGKGQIETYTIIHSAPEGFEKEVPYVVAIVKTDGDVRISGQVVDLDVNEIISKNIDLVGMKVKTTFRRMFQDNHNGLIHYGTKWKMDRA